MKLPLYVVDAFADRPFTGNPAAICILEAWLSKQLMQSIAAEMNLSETAFLVPTAQGWHIRWFTPTIEVDLVGHATLAAAFVIFERFAPGIALLAVNDCGAVRVDPRRPQQKADRRQRHIIGRVLVEAGRVGIGAVLAHPKPVT